MASLNPLLGRKALRASSSLSRYERELFMSMNRYDLAHCLAVASRLEDNPLLYKTALLHDVGKLSSDVSMSSRWLYTAMQLLAPSRLRGIGARVEAGVAGDTELQRARSLPRGWRRGLYFQLHHGEIGSELLREAGSEPEMVRLVREHQREATDELSRRLAEVDDTF